MKISTEIVNRQYSESTEFAIIVRTIPYAKSKEQLEKLAKKIEAIPNADEVEH